MKKLDRDDLYASGYVLGFYFSPNDARLVMIKKKRPKQQANKLNGVGGRIKAGESHLSAMIREFEEETGVREETWRYHGVYSPLRSRDVYIHVFYGVGDVTRCRTMTDEEVVIIDLQRELGDVVLVSGAPEWIFECRCELGKYPLRKPEVRIIT